MPVDEEYAPGLWRPAVPLPYLGWIGVRCVCGRRFWGISAYDYLRSRNGRVRRHYEDHYRAGHAGGNASA
ncbi:MAG: hypothetical protein ACLQFR_07620 [Streptosporangiaceae bacterium]